MELGYSFTSSVEECRTALASLGAREISPTCVAHILSHMIRSCNILDDPGGLQTFWGNSATSQDSNKEKPSETSTPTTWNIEVFIQALKEIVSLPHIFIMFITFIMYIHYIHDKIFSQRFFIYVKYFIICNCFHIYYA